MATVKATVQTPGRRQRSEGKRSVIMDAAEGLFVTDGYELTSVDAIAARANVSKRTVYDHFGDKQALFRTVLERVNNALTETVRSAIDQELTADRDLREALMGFAMWVATETFPSSDYVTFRRLTSGRSAPQLPASARNAPERMLEERFAKLAADGELRAHDPHRAVQHFVALTARLALDVLDETSGVDEPAIHRIIGDGVDAFLRAYGPQRESRR